MDIKEEPEDCAFSNNNYFVAPLNEDGKDFNEPVHYKVEENLPEDIKQEEVDIKDELLIEELGLLESLPSHIMPPSTNKSQLEIYSGEQCHIFDTYGYKTTREHRKSSTKSNWTRHMQTHTGEKPFRRNNSGDKAKDEHTTELKSYECNLCNYKARAKATLKRHSITHGLEKPYSCNICEHKTFRKDDLKTHIRTHTGEKPFTCNLCEFKTPRKHRLEMHIRTHTGEKPYSCTVCEYKTTENYKLMRHFRTHTGEKPYSCTMCEYRATEKNKLDRHVRTHAGENPIRVTCSSTYRQQKITEGRFTPQKRVYRLRITSVLPSNSRVIPNTTK